MKDVDVEELRKAMEIYEDYKRVEYEIPLRISIFLALLLDKPKDEPK